jgi:hypothetical protein
VTPDWASTEDVLAAIGQPVTDTDHLDNCVEAANAFAWRRRQQAGYTADDPFVAPGPDVTLGVVSYATALYRERGTVESFASFDAFAAGAVPSSSMGQVLRLLGVPRPAVDSPPVVLRATPYRTIP